MNIYYMHTLRDMVSKQAVDMKWRTIPQLQIPLVEYVVPSGEDAEKVLADTQRRLVLKSLLSFTAKLITKGAQTRVRVEYRT